MNEEVRAQTIEISESAKKVFQNIQKELIRVHEEDGLLTYNKTLESWNHVTNSFLSMSFSKHIEIYADGASRLNLMCHEINPVTEKVVYTFAMIYSPSSKTWSIHT